jgi:hypothetical protein
MSRGQVNTYWNWADVHIADLFANDVERWSAEGVSSEACVLFSFVDLSFS